MSSPDKRVTLVIYGADRRLWAGGAVSIQVRDLFRARDILTTTATGATVELRLQLPFDSGQVYGIAVGHARCRTAWVPISRRSFLRDGLSSESGTVIARPMIVPDEASSLDLAGGWGRLDTRESPFTKIGGLGLQDYLALGSGQPAGFGAACQMTFLNIEAKLRETVITGTPLLDLVYGVERVGPDRVFLWMKERAKDAVGNDGIFAVAPGHPGHPDSWKHGAFPDGNVQLSFARDPTPVQLLDLAPESCFSVDVDIDLARGIGHWAEWLRNNVFQPGHKTDQTDVYALLYAQGILPAYTLAQISHAIAA